MPSPRRGRQRRSWPFVAAALLIASLAAVPAVTAQGGDGDHQDTVTVCHFEADNGYAAAQAPETDFFGASRRGHGADMQDIVPPFVIENPRPGDPSSFDGRNWDDRDRTIYDAGCVESAPEPSAPPEPDKGGPPTKVRICHATSSEKNPYVSNEPAIANNGDLNGGHLNHEGPVYPAPDWGDIIPPYTYVDKDGHTQTFPGYNWSDEGQAIWQNGCEPPAPPEPKPLTPVVECVEKTANGFLAHFGYRNPNGTTVEATGDQNAFSPPPANRGQPTSFAADGMDDAFQVESDGSALTWHLTGSTATATSSSPACGGSITITKRLVPADDPGLFGLGSTVTSQAARRQSATGTRRGRSPSPPGGAP